MEYIAIPKEDFIKYFKIIEAKKGKVKAIKNELAVKKSKKGIRNPKRKRKQETSDESSDAATDGSATDRATDAATESDSD